MPQAPEVQAPKPVRSKKKVGAILSDSQECEQASPMEPPLGLSNELQLESPATSELEDLRLEAPDEMLLPLPALAMRPGLLWSV